MMFEKYVEVVRASRPQVLVLENVPGMKIIHRRRNVVDLMRQSFFERLTESLSNAGYAVEGDLVDASRFGVPQRRNRLIAIGIRKDLRAGLMAGSSAPSTYLKPPARPNSRNWVSTLP